MDANEIASLVACLREGEFDLIRRDDDAQTYVEIPGTHRPKQAADLIESLSTQLAAALKRAEDAERERDGMFMARQAYLSIAEKARQLNFNLEADLAAANDTIAKLEAKNKILFKALEPWIVKPHTTGMLTQPASTPSEPTT